jgi:hypothetical protein
MWQRAAILTLLVIVAAVLLVWGRAAGEPAPPPERPARSYRDADALATDLDATITWRRAEVAGWYTTAHRTEVARANQTETNRTLRPNKRATTVETPAIRPTGNCGGWEPTIASLWPADQVARACRIAMCESNGNPGAQNNSSSAAGLFQLLSLHAWRFEAHGWSWADRYNGARNAVVAHDLWTESGWAPWVCN